MACDASCASFALRKALQLSVFAMDISTFSSSYCCFVKRKSDNSEDEAACSSEIQAAPSLFIVVHRLESCKTVHILLCYFLGK